MEHIDDTLHNPTCPTIFLNHECMPPWWENQKLHIAYDSQQERNNTIQGKQQPSSIASSWFFENTLDIMMYVLKFCTIVISLLFPLILKMVGKYVGRRNTNSSYILVFYYFKTLTFLFYSIIASLIIAKEYEDICPISVIV